MKIGIRIGERIKKSFSQQVQELAKAREGLVQREVEVHRGGKTFKQKRWVKPGEDVAQGRGKKTDTEKKPGSGESRKRLGIKVSKPKPGRYGMHNIEVGDSITFESPDGKSLSGEIKLAGKDGVTVSADGQEHRVLWKDIRGFTPKAGTKKPDYNERYFNKKKEFIEPEKFTAAEWSKQWADPKATPNEAGVAYILDSLGNDNEAVKKAILETEKKIEGITQTFEKYRQPATEGESAKYTPERKKLHAKIMKKLLRPDKLRSALPPVGEKPTFMILGGRGGSGKSWFKIDPKKNPGGGIYNPNKFVILDADEIKKEIPEFDNWNAKEVHEESSDILEMMLAKCVKKGLNIVLDGTMKTAHSAMAKVLRTKAAGYRTEAHYMYCPPQEAAKRAVKRFKGDNGQFKGRYVPVGVVLENTTNEDSFDQVKQWVDSWSFRDNFNKGKNDPPIIISEGEKPVKKSFAALVKSLI